MTDDGEQLTEREQLEKLRLQEAERLRQAAAEQRQRDKAGSEWLRALPRTKPAPGEAIPLGGGLWHKGPRRLAGGLTWPKIERAYRDLAARPAGPRFRRQHPDQPSRPEVANELGVPISTLRNACPAWPPRF